MISVFIRCHALFKLQNNIYKCEKMLTAKLLAKKSFAIIIYTEQRKNIKLFKLYL